MEYLIALFVMSSVALLVMGVVGLVPAARADALKRRLVDTRRMPHQVEARERRKRRDTVARFLEDVGERFSERTGETETARVQLARAGYYGARAVPIYYGLRVVGMFGLGAIAGAYASALGLSVMQTVMLTLAVGGLGWFLPRFVLKKKIKARQKELRKALADALDMMVVCVEAGLGLNQAFLRVSEDIAPVSRAMAEELSLVNLQIRAGTPRDEAMRDLGTRTGVDDIKALTGMLIQTDRFGTSIAKALRVHAETLRTKRRQRAEEEAAKTTIKLVFPLALFIFPAMFVVILGPALFHIFAALGGATR